MVTSGFKTGREGGSVPASDVVVEVGGIIRAPSSLALVPRHLRLKVVVRAGVV